MRPSSPVPEVVSPLPSVADGPRFVSMESPCPYLAGRESRHQACVFDALDGKTYEMLLGRGYRRSGRIVYRPTCRSCNECQQLRIPVDEFRPTGSMRRVWRRNADVWIETGRPVSSDDRFEVYTRYLDAQHDETMAREREGFDDFLYDSPTDTMEFVYRIGERVVGVSIADCVPNGLSSVYMYFDPEFARRSLGTYSILREIEFCREQRLSYYYLGYYVEKSPTMSYKGRFRPYELLVGDGLWRGNAERGEA